LVTIQKWLAGREAATNGDNRVFGDEAPIGVVYYFRGRVRFARSAQAHDALALLHEARPGGKFEAKLRRGNIMLATHLQVLV
jgi:hypothetical protein